MCDGCLDNPAAISADGGCWLAVPATDVGDRLSQGLGNALIAPCPIVESQHRIIGRRSRLEASSTTTNEGPRECVRSSRTIRGRGNLEIHAAYHKAMTSCIGASLERAKTRPFTDISIAFDTATHFDVRQWDAAALR